MKEKLYTIPLNDAVNENDECPFCFIERKLERDALDFTLGSSSSYMESDIRAQTDAAGFCREHTKKNVRLRQYPGQCPDPENPLSEAAERNEGPVRQIYSRKILISWQVPQALR